MFRCEQVDHALEVVSHDRDADLCLGSMESAKQQARVAEDAVLECAEGMLDGLDLQKGDAHA